MQAPAAESALPRRGPILLQFWAENFDSAYPMLDLINTLINGREAARGVAGNVQGAASSSAPKPGKTRYLIRRREFCGLVTRNDENGTTRTFDYALRGASQKQPP